MSQKLKNFVVLLTILFSALLLIKFVSALGSDDCVSNWRLVFHKAHQEKCYALAKPTCKQQEPQPAVYPKCLTQPNCLAEAKLIKVNGQPCLDQADLGCEAAIIEENSALAICPPPSCYNVLPADSCQQGTLPQSVKFIGQDDPRCKEGQGQPADNGYCSCKVFSDEDLSLKSYLNLSGGLPCDLTSSDNPLYITPEVKTLTPFCKNYKINIQRVCRGAPLIDKVYLDGNPNVNYGPPGSKIVIDGLNLGNTIKVEVGGQPAEILSVGGNQVKVKIYKDPSGQDPHWCTNSVVLTTKSNQTRINDLLNSAVADTSIERSAVGYFIVASKKVSAAELDRDGEDYGTISFAHDKGVFGSTLILENNKDILGVSADRSWVTFAGPLETQVEFYSAEKTYWTADTVRVKIPRAIKEKTEGKIRVHLCSPEENRDVYLETDKDFKLIDPSTTTSAELSELKPKIAYFTPNFGVNRRQWQVKQDPYNSEYQEEISLFGRNFNLIDQVSIIDQNGAEFMADFVIEDQYKIIIQLPAVNLPSNGLELYFSQFKACRKQDCVLSKSRFYFQDYSPAVVRSPAIQEVKTLPAKADGFDFIPPYFYKLNQEVEISGRNFGNQRNESQVLFWSPDGYLEAGGYSKWSNRQIQAIAPSKILSSAAEYQNFSRGTLPIMICTPKYGCSSSLNYYPREKFAIGALADPNQTLAELGQPEIIPEIFHLDKLCAGPGEAITVRGYNFWDKQTDTDEDLEYYVSFQGENDTRVKAASYPAWSAEEIQATAPLTAKTGRLAVHRRDKNSTDEKIGFSDEILSISSSCSVSSGYCFVGNQLPEIYQVDPAQEYIGLNQAGVSLGAQEKVITIRGCNLGAARGASYVLFNDVKHNQILSWNAYEVKTLAPFDAISGSVSLYIWDGSAGYYTNELNFQANPVIQKILPSRGAAGQIITVLGSDFCQTASCLQIPSVYLSFYQDLGLTGVKAKQLLNFNRRQIQFKLDRGWEDDYDLMEANEGEIDTKSAIYSGLLYVKRSDGVLSRPYQTKTDGHFGYFVDRAPNFFTKLPLLKDITPNAVLAGQDSKILLKGENFYGTANLPTEFYGYAYGSYPKTRIWNYFLENLNLATKEDYLVKQGIAFNSNTADRQSLEMQEMVATYVLSPFTQKNGLINRHSILGINYDGSFGMFFKSNSPRLDLRTLVNYEAENQEAVEQISLSSGRAYFGYFSYGRNLIPKFNLLADQIMPFELKIKNPDSLRADPSEKAEVEFTVNKQLATIYKSDRISLNQSLPEIDQQGIFDIRAVVDQTSGQVNFDFSFYNGIERYYQCNYLDAPAGREKTIVCNSEPYFPGVLPAGQSAVAGYGFFQTNQFMIDCAPPKIKNIAVVSGSLIKVSGENLNNVSVAINGKGYKAGYANGSLSVSLSKKLSPGSYVLRTQSKDRCATYPKYDENNFKIY